MRDIGCLTAPNADQWRRFVVVQGSEPMGPITRRRFAETFLDPDIEVGPIGALGRKGKTASDT